MQLIELPVFLGAPLAKWRRMLSSSSVWELLHKVRQRISSKVFVLYRKSLALAFRLRNFLTGNAAVKTLVGEMSLALAPEGPMAFHLWSGLRCERAELGFVLDVLQPGMTFFDIGAGCGLFSIAAARKFPGETESIYAFEPCRSTFFTLQRNLLLNKLANVRTWRLALSDRTGDASLLRKDALDALEDLDYSAAEAPPGEAVETLTLDEFVARENVSRVDVMRVEGQGAELLVFRGGGKLLARMDAPLILYEGDSQCTAGFHYHPVELLWQLEAFGYELFILDDATSSVRRRKPAEGYDATVVAVKQSHSRYDDIFPPKERA